MTSTGAGRWVVVLVALAAGLGGCGSGDEAGSTTTTAPAESTTEPPLDEVLAGDIPAAVCQTDARTIETAAEAFLASEGAYPGSVAEMEGTFLDDAPRYHELRVVSPDGIEVVPVPGAGCD